MRALLKILLGKYDLIVELGYLECYYIRNAEVNLGVSSHRDSLEPIYELEM